MMMDVAARHGTRPKWARGVVDPVARAGRGGAWVQPSGRGGAVMGRPLKAPLLGGGGRWRLRAEQEEEGMDLDLEDMFQIFEAADTAKEGETLEDYTMAADVQDEDTGVPTPYVTVVALTLMVIAAFSFWADQDPASAAVLDETTSYPLAFADQFMGGKTTDLQQMSGSLFATSLAPYLGFLYFLKRENNGTPPLLWNGFCFLLLFVFSTIAGGIYTKVTYGLSLADVDLVHGTAESLLTITNLICVYGLRGALRGQQGSVGDNNDSTVGTAALVAVAAAVFAAYTQFGGASEPSNALSIPTWVVHWSSIFEQWYVIDLLRRYADATGNPRWKGLALAYTPFHLSGLCACTYHTFYNHPDMQWLVFLQALTTFIGNSTLAVGAYRLSQYTSSQPQPPAEAQYDLVSDTAFGAKILVASVAMSVAVKYGELLLGFPGDANSWVGAGTLGSTIVAGAFVLPTTFARVTSALGDGEGQPEMQGRKDALVR